MASQSTDDRFDRSSVLTTTVRGENAALGLTELSHSSGSIWIAGPAGPTGTEARVIVRATDVVLSLAPPHELSARSALSSTVSKIQFDGPLATVELALEGGGRLFATVTRGALNELEIKPGSHVFALFKTTALDERGIGGIPAHVSENSADLTTSKYQRNPRA